MSIKRIVGGGKKGQQAPTPQEAIQKLNDVEEMLRKKSDLLQKTIDHETETAKKHGTKNKRLALPALKRKKHCEKRLEQINGMLSTIEFQRDILENVSTHAEVQNVIGIAAKALKTLKTAQNSVDEDDESRMRDDIAEQQDIAEEISEAISNPTAFRQDIDEDELLAELLDLEQEEFDKQRVNVQATSVAKLPEVPTGEPTVAARTRTGRSTAV